MKPSAQGGCGWPKDMSGGVHYMPNGFSASPPAPTVPNPFTDARARLQVGDNDVIDTGLPLNASLGESDDDDSDNSAETTSAAYEKTITKTTTTVRDAQTQTDESGDQKAARLLKQLLQEDSSLLQSLVEKHPDVICTLMR